jgi:small conductance mechanosensitive channel
MRRQDTNEVSPNGAGGEANGNGAEEGSAFDLTQIDAETVTHVAENYGLPAVKVVLILLAAWILAGWIRRIVVRSMERSKIEITIARFIGNMARWGVLLLSVIAVLGIFGVPTASLVAVVGALGLAVGLALQGTLGNAAAGFLLLIFRPFRVGDFISAGGVSGKVFEIELFSTSIDTTDNRRIIVPNGAVFGATIENVTHHATRRLDVPVGVSYDAKLDETRAALNKAVELLETRLEEPAHAVVLSGLGDSSVDWVVRVWVNASDYWPTKEALTANIKNCLDEAGIGIPYPQMDVHINPTDAAKAV